MNAARADGAGRPLHSRYRWTIVALLFAATTINYVDRQVLGILAPTLQRTLGWTETDYGRIVSWFSVAYGVGYLVMGRVLDQIGTRAGLAASIVVWSAAAMAHALARTVGGFSLARAALGLGEAGNFPGAVKTIAEWFPRKERALAAGIFNAGTNVGAIAAPLAVPWIVLRWGWQWAFIATGAIGFVWLAAWLPLYHPPDRERRVSAEELAYIDADREPPQADVRWRELLRHRQAWAVIVGKALTDPVWYFYLFWLPKFLDRDFGVKLAGLAAPLVTIYVLADAGSVIGGWMSSALIARGWSVNRSRKTTLLVAALLVVPTMAAPHTRSMWTAVAVVSLAAAAHQWWSANVYTLASDMFPRRAVASVVGLGGFAGAMAAMLAQRATGRHLDVTGSSYSAIFVVCALAYVVAWGAIQILVPRMAVVPGRDR